jgi:hypothetical protein
MRTGTAYLLPQTWSAGVLRNCLRPSTILDPSAFYWLLLLLVRSSATRGADAPSENRESQSQQTHDRRTGALCVQPQHANRVVAQPPELWRGD